MTAGDGPDEFHVVLLDNGRTTVLADEQSRETPRLHPLRRVPERVPGLPADRRPRVWLDLQRPIGAILTPQLQSMEHSQCAADASSLCGACYEVCPVKINIPEILIHLRQQIVEHGEAPLGERIAMRAAGFALGRRGPPRESRRSWRAPRSGRSCATAASSTCRRR